MSKARDSVEDLKTLDANLAAKLPKSGGALTGAVTTNSTFDGVAIATRDGVLTSTTATAAAALPKAGGTMTGKLNVSSTYASDITEQVRFQDNTGGKLDFFGYGNGGKGIQAYADDGSTFYNLSLQPLGGGVGIGTSSPTNALSVEKSITGDWLAEFKQGDATVGSSYGVSIQGGTNASDEALNVSNQAGSSYLVVKGNGDVLVKQGNVVVGATAVGGVSSGTKTYITSTGNLYVASSGEEAAYFNRNSNDGSIVEFRKGNAAVGSIGVLASRLSIGTGDVGLFFNDQTNQVQPFNTSTNSARDNGIDLGASDRRFRDVYTAGGVYLGGTGAANKLDDYEEGTWTPGYAFGGSFNGVYSNQQGFYTKVGNMVHAKCFISCANHGSTTGSATVTGLPFASNSTYVSYSAVSQRYTGISTTNYPASYLGFNSTVILLQQITSSGGNTTNLQHSAFNTYTDLMINVTYQV